MNADYYLENISWTSKPFALFANHNSLLMQDNARIHMVGQVTDYLRAVPILLMEWPPKQKQSWPEHLWDPLFKIAKARRLPPVKSPVKISLTI